jgi:hypothetical protein
MSSLASSLEGDIHLAQAASSCTNRSSHLGSNFDFESYVDLSSGVVHDAEGMDWEADTLTWNPVEGKSSNSIITGSSGNALVTAPNLFAVEEREGRSYNSFDIPDNSMRPHTTVS